MRGKAIPQKLVEKMSAADRQALGLMTNAEKAEKCAAVEEKEIQRTVEAWLRQRGYWPRSDAFLDGKVPPSGWYIHVHAAKRNPIVLDLLVLRPEDGRFFELELKTATGSIRPAQAAILKGGASGVARSTLEAIELITEWENKLERRVG